MRKLLPICLFLAVAADARSADQSLIEAAETLRYVTTGGAQMEPVLQFDVRDTGAGDGLPTIIKGITLHGDASEHGYYTGADFEWVLESPDIDGASTPNTFAATAVDASSVFALSFVDEPLLHVPDGESRTVTIHARYVGEISGEFPFVRNPSPVFDVVLFIHADLEQGDFITESEEFSSQLSSGIAGPDLGPIHIFVDAPTLQPAVPLPDRVGMDTKLEVILEIVDRYGNRVTGSTEELDVYAILSHSKFIAQPFGETRGPQDGYFRFDIDDGSPLIDNRLDFTNDKRFPGGQLDLTVRNRGGSGQGHYRLRSPRIPIYVETDENSTITELSAASVIEADADFQSVWELQLEDQGTLDQLPTAIYELVVDVQIGDGCLYSAQDFDWRLITDGLVFYADEVTESEVIFRGEEIYGTGSGLDGHPAVYTRKEPGFMPLLFAPDGGLGTFSIEVATDVTNAALDETPIALDLYTWKLIPFKFMRSLLSSRVELGSLVEKNVLLSISAPPTINVESPVSPADLCPLPPEGEGEGATEGQIIIDPEGENTEIIHTADRDGDNWISLSEVLRIIQFVNSLGFSCANPPGSTEDGYQPGPGETDCAPHDADYRPQNFNISISELLRMIQFFNIGGYYSCPGREPPTEDGYCTWPR